MKAKLALTLACIIFLSACASSGKHVPRHARYTTISYGAVIDREAITIGGTHTGIGSYIGSAAAIHDATSDSFLGLLVRGFAGAIIGAMAEEAVTRKSGMLYTIETSKGALLEVASTNKEINAGDCVEILHAGIHHTEIEPAPPTACLSSSAKQT